MVYPMDYVAYNREERDLCAHLFRLLLEDQPRWRPLCQFLGVDTVSNPRVFCEMALLRDAYFARKPDTSDLLSRVCDLIAEQNGAEGYTRFGDLPADLKDPRRTHPKQIGYKLNNEHGPVSDADKTVYGSLQAMCNAKPDLVICEGTSLFVYEAKYTLGFDQAQLVRTRHIAEVWATLLYEDLGFSDRPAVHVRTLGLGRYEPDVTWETVHSLAKEWWGEQDFSVRVLGKVLPK